MTALWHVHAYLIFAGYIFRDLLVHHGNHKHIDLGYLELYSNYNSQSIIQSSHYNSFQLIELSVSLYVIGGHTADINDDVNIMNIDNSLLLP